MSILIVDDAQEIRLLLKTMLEKAGYNELIFAQSAEETYNILGVSSEGAESDHSAEIDLILMDVGMPEIDGIEACKKIKKIERLRDIPVVMISAMAEKKLLEVALDSGAIDYITKPLSKVELLARVRSCLRLKKEIDHRKAHKQELLVLTAQLKEANIRLRKLSNVDGLTSLSNRRHFDETLKREWKRAMRGQIPISIIMIDLDFFKKYNDAHGHIAGDDCLKKVANILSEKLRRPADVVARYGGEEFVVLIPETETEAAIHLAEGMRSDIDNLKLIHPESSIELSMTISLGIATCTPARNSDPAELVSLADKALYRAKEEGRNRIVVAD